MNINDSPILFIGGYYEQGDGDNLIFLKPRQSQLEAERDAAQTGEPVEWRVVAEVEIVSIARPPKGQGSNPPAKIRTAHEARKS
jgi:hypothetical protein